MTFQTPEGGRDFYIGNFLPHTIRDWNTLQESIISSAEIVDKDKEVLFNVAYNEIDNISSQTILWHYNIFDKYLTASLYLPSTTSFCASVSRGAASTSTFVDHLSFFCLVFVMLLCTSVYFVPCDRLLRKGCPLGSSFVVSHCKFVTFPLVS